MRTHIVYDAWFPFLKAVSPRLYGFCHERDARHRTALNGIEQRCVLVRWLHAQNSFACFVETGTYLGHSTVFFGALVGGCPVYSTETDLEFYRRAQARTHKYPNIVLRSMDSVKLLTTLGDDCKNQRVFVYLDAHWEKHLPLLEELEICLQWKDAIIMIDDFRVPHDANFWYDDYGTEGVLELDYIKLVLQKHGLKQVFFPSSVPDYPVSEALASLYGMFRYSTGFVLLATNPKAHGMLKKAPLLVEHVV